MSTAYRLFASFGTIALFVASGYALTAFVPSLREKSFVRRLAWAYLLGIAYAGVTLYALSHWAGVELRRGAILSVLAVPLVLAASRGRAARRREGRTGPSLSRFQRAACAAALGAGGLVSAAVLAHAVSSVESGYDPRMTWNAAAAYVRTAHSVNPPALLDKNVYIQNPRYPLLLPVLQVVGQEIFDTDDDERTPRPLYALLLPVLLLLVFDVAQPHAGTTAAAVTVVVIAFLPAVVFDIGSGALTSYSDLPLGILWGAGLVLALRAPWSPPEALAGGLLLGAAALAKTEGLLLAGVAVGIVCLRAARRLVRRFAGSRRGGPWLRAAGGTLAVFLFAAALNLSWRAGIPNRYAETWDDVTLRQVLSGTAARIPVVLPLLGTQMARAELWSGFWWLAAAVFVLGIRAFVRPPARFLSLAVAGALCVYIAAYGASGWAPSDLVPTTWNRFLCQLSLPVFVLFAMALGNALRSFVTTGWRRTGLSG